MPDVQSLDRARIAELVAFWREAFPLHPMTEALIRERIFDPPDAAPERLICYRDGKGDLAAIAALMPPGPPDPKTGERVGGIRWFGAHPKRRGQGLGTALLDESCERLRAAGATTIDFLSTPPYYIQPGVDVRLTSVIAWLLGRGFEHCRTNFNMTVDLERFHCPPVTDISPADGEGYAVRRATEADREAFGRLCLAEWTANWRDEASQGLRHDPISLFLAVKIERGREEFVGFASYETSQCLGCFGPTGVGPVHQGRGLGKRLLWATLADLQALGREECQIGWVGPVDFYHHACGAVLGPVFWAMRKRLRSG